MELRHLRYFVAVAEELNFHRAAQRLNISQPPLTTQIQNLERLLDVQLLDRNKQRVQVTAAGRELLAHARAILADVARLKARVASAATGEGGELRVGYSESASYVGFVLETLQAFRMQRPGVALSLVQLNSSAQLAALELGELDVGFVWGLPVRPPESLEIERIWDQPFKLAAPAGHTAAAQAAGVDLAQLAGERFVTISRDGGALLFREITRICRTAGFTPQIVEEAPTLPAVLGLVAGGAGLAIVPAAMERLQLPGVAYLPLSGGVYRAELHWVARRGSDLPLVPVLRQAMFDRALTQTRPS